MKKIQDKFSQNLPIFHLYCHIIRFLKTQHLKVHENSRAEQVRENLSARKFLQIRYDWMSCCSKSRHLKDRKRTTWGFSSLLDLNRKHNQNILCSSEWSLDIIGCKRREKMKRFLPLFYHIVSFTQRICFIIHFGDLAHCEERRTRKIIFTRWWEQKNEIF